MALSPEVQAAAVKVAGDWAGKIAAQAKVGSGAIMKKQFALAYDYIIKTIEERQL